MRNGKYESKRENWIAYANSRNHDEKANAYSWPKYSTYAHEIKEAVNIKAVAQAVERYNTGAAIYWQENSTKYIVLPPLPITEDKISLGELDASPY